MFAQTFVINLTFKTERLQRFLAAVPKSLGPVQVWPAVHGDTVIHPDWWTAGRGAWGCYRSHLQILEHCYNSGCESYLVFEDDAIFRPDFEALLAQGLPIKAIAGRVGLTSSARLGQAFERRFGMPPSLFREMHRPA